MADLRGANLTDADLIKADLRDADLTWTNFSGAKLTWAFLTDADLTQADLRGADISWARLIRAKFTGADLSRAVLTNAYLREANLTAADLSEASLKKAGLRAANLTDADLNKAILSGADLAWANLTGTDLRGADISDVQLIFADLSKSIFGWTYIANINLKEVKGLKSIIHKGPSSIGIDTIYKSQGEIPEIFLRGVGVPDNFIEYMPHLMGDAIQLYSCFISYSTRDQQFAERLHSDLQSKGVRCWFAPEDVKGGRKLHEQIPEAIRLYDKLLLVLSENSMKSEWVKTEIYHARQDEISTSKRKLFPIGLVNFNEIRRWVAFDADSGKDMAREVREYFIPDFSNWKDHDIYKKAFDRLMRDLEAED